VTDNQDDIGLYAQLTIGKDADAFWSSSLGRYVLQRSLSQTESIRAQFKTVDPNDSKKVLELQTEWKVAEQALVWINEAIMAGRAARGILEQEQEAR